MTYLLTIVDSIHPGRPPLTMNDYAKAHWTKKRQARDRIHYQVKQALQKQPLPMFDRARIAIVQHAPDGRRRDVDGLNAFRKAALDALVRLGVLPDDNLRHVIDGGNRIELSSPHPRIVIELEHLA